VLLGAAIATRRVSPTPTASIIARNRQPPSCRSPRDRIDASVEVLDRMEGRLAFENDAASGCRSWRWSIESAICVPR